MDEAARPTVYSLHEQGSNQLMIPPGGDRGSDRGRAGVDCLGNPSGDLIHR